MRGFDNMKKAFSVFLLIATFVNLFVFSAFAESANNIGDNDEVNVVVNEDGSKTYKNEDGTVTTITAIQIIDVASTNTTTLSTNETKTAAGKISAMNTDPNTGAVNWRYTLYGYFTYVEGESSRCTDAHYTIDIANSSWHLTSGNAYIKSNGSYGTGKMEYKVLFITINTVLIDLHIFCDVNGNLYQ